jgi:hypothetical protein
MAVYTIIATVALPGLAADVAREYPEHHAWSDRAWAVRTDDTAQTVAGKLGVSGRDAAGNAASKYGHIVVMQATSNYWGFGPTPFWDWLKSAFERGS